MEKTNVLKILGKEKFKASKSGFLNTISHGLYGIAGAENIGLTSFIHQHFIINPISMNLENIKIMYFFSENIENIILKFVSYYYNFIYDEGLPLDYDIDMNDEVKKRLEFIQESYIDKLFGTDKASGIIEWCDKPVNATEIKYKVIDWHKKNGRDEKEEYIQIGSDEMPVRRIRDKEYKKNIDAPRLILIIDKGKKIKSDDSYKKSVDVLSSEMQYLSNHYQFPCVIGLELDKSFANINSLKYHGEYMYPTLSNVSCDTSYFNTIYTIFEPCNKTYRLKSHLGVEIDGDNESWYRTVHCVKASIGRKGHFFMNFCRYTWSMCKQLSPIYF
jgi:hypothetical protein